MIALLGAVLMVCGLVYALHCKPTSKLVCRMGAAIMAGTGAIVAIADTIRPDLMIVAAALLGILLLLVAAELTAFLKGKK